MPVAVRARPRPVRSRSLASLVVVIVSMAILCGALFAFAGASAPAQRRVPALVRQELPPGERFGGGGVMTTTDDAAGERVLDDVQLDKLARAREAVERSRQAGTYDAQGLVPRTPEVVLDPAAVEAAKWDRHRTQQPEPYDPRTDAPHVAGGK